ncbi:MAG: hypothetical protein FWD88_01260 [Treponema sp.]|nr:hypothetical protein [Treponema sp.]
MRVFLCAFGNFALAVPMNSVSSLANLADLPEEHGAVARDAVAHDPENRGTYVSLPLLFGLPPENIKHGIVLKNPDSGDGENRTILFSPEIVREIEIPDDEIYPMPKVLDGTRFSMLFAGIRLSDVPVLRNPVLLLDPERLALFVRKETAA